MALLICPLERHIVHFQPRADESATKIADSLSFPCGYDGSKSMTLLRRRCWDLISASMLSGVLPQRAVHAELRGSWTIT
jgi:hypothetical protein